MTLYSLDNIEPETPDSGDFWVADSAVVIGNVTLQDATSIWFGSVLRGDHENICVGAGSNIQENSVLHTDLGFPLSIGTGCTIGHKTILHGCTIGDNTLIGMGACVLNGAEIGNNCLIGAGALVTQGKKIPDGSMVVGAPAKVVRALTDEEIEGLKASDVGYQNNMRRFKAGLRPLPTAWL